MFEEKRQHLPFTRLTSPGSHELLLLAPHFPRPWAASSIKHQIRAQDRPWKYPYRHVIDPENRGIYRPEKVRRLGLRLNVDDNDSTRWRTTFRPFLSVGTRILDDGEYADGPQKHREGMPNMER